MEVWIALHAVANAYVSTAAAFHVTVAGCHRDSLAAGRLVAQRLAIVQAPGATLAGSVKVGTGSHIGCGATVIQSVSIGRNAIVGAGAVVTADVADNAVVVGVPARILQRQDAA